VVRNPDAEQTAVIDMPSELELYAATHHLPPGTQIPLAKNYEIIETLGEGGMGQIYRAYDPTMDRYVALKVLKEGIEESELHRFLKEARLAGNFSHPNLVRVLEVGEADSMHWLAMEWLRGRDIGHVLGSRKQTNFRLVVEIFSQVLDALEYVHTRSIVHCDIKPENIFITRDPFDRRLVIAKLIDFGIAKVLNGPMELQRYITGDPRYMAPEQTILNGPVDARTDLYALGMSFFEMVAMEHPFEDSIDLEPLALLELQKTRKPPSLSSRLPPGIKPELAEALDSFFEASCAKKPEHRFQNAKAMRRALDELMGMV
jgi:serine/threonine-protein kinase